MVAVFVVVVLLLPMLPRLLLLLILVREFFWKLLVLIYVQFVQVAGCSPHFLIVTCNQHVRPCSFSSRARVSAPPLHRISPIYY